MSSRISWPIWLLVGGVSMAIALPSDVTSTRDGRDVPTVIVATLLTRAAQPLDGNPSDILKRIYNPENSTASAESTGASSPLTSTNGNEIPLSPPPTSPALLSAMIVTATLMCILIVIIAWFASRFNKMRQEYVAQARESKRQLQCLSTAHFEAKLKRPRCVSELDGKLFDAGFISAKNMVPRAEWGAHTLMPAPRAVRGTAGHVDDPSAEAAKGHYAELKDILGSIESPSTNLYQRISTGSQNQPLSPASSMDEVSLKYARTAEIVGIRQSKVVRGLGDITEVDYAKTARQIKRSRTADVERGQR